MMSSVGCLKMKCTGGLEPPCNVRRRESVVKGEADCVGECSAVGGTGPSATSPKVAGEKQRRRRALSVFALASNVRSHLARMQTPRGSACRRRGSAGGARPAGVGPRFERADVRRGARQHQRALVHRPTHIPAAPTRRRLPAADALLRIARRALRDRLVRLPILRAPTTTPDHRFSLLFFYSATTRSHLDK